MAFQASVLEFLKKPKPEQENPKSQPPREQRTNYLIVSGSNIVYK